MAVVYPAVCMSTLTKLGNGPAPADPANVAALVAGGALGVLLGQRRKRLTRCRSRVGARGTGGELVKLGTVRRSVRCTQLEVQGAVQ